MLVTEKLTAYLFPQSACITIHNH